METEEASRRRPTEAWIRSVPKIELHCHLDGSLWPATIWELAQAEGIDLPVDGPDEVRRFFTAERSSLEDYLELFGYSLQLLQRAETLQRAVVELVEDVAAETGIYVEIRFAPMLHGEQGLSPERVVEAALDGLGEGRSATGVDGGLILCGMRQAEPGRTLEVARLAEAYRDSGVVGFDLAGPEKGYPLRRHEAAVARARDAGLGVTLHAGEAPCPEHITEALELEADRVGHGLHLDDAPSHVRSGIRQRGIPLEMCPTSNLQTAQFADYADHPLARHLRNGYRVTVNTDNRLMSNTTLTEEFVRVAEACELCRDEILQLVSHAARAAFASGLLSRWRRDLEAISA